jgi:multidrug efflux pump
VVFGLGIATMLTLILTPAFLALRVWVGTYMTWIGRLLARITAGRSSRIARDMRLGRSARKLNATEIIWEDLPDTPLIVPAVVDSAPEKAKPEDRPEQPAPVAKQLIAAIKDSQKANGDQSSEPQDKALNPLPGAPLRAAE